MSRLVFTEEPSLQSSEFYVDEKIQYSVTSSSKKFQSVSVREVPNKAASRQSEHESNGYKTSNWLSQFLSRKRIDEVALVPETIPMQDDYIRGFHERFGRESEEQDEIDLTWVQNSVEDSTKDATLTDGSIVLPVEDQISPPLLASITIFNLPYLITVDEVSQRKMHSPIQFNCMRLIGRNVWKEEWVYFR